MRRAAALALGGCIGFQAHFVDARELYSSMDGEDSVNLSSALKSSLLLAKPPQKHAAALATNFWRARSTLDAHLDSGFGATLAYEHRVLLSSSDGQLGVALLPPTKSLPYRIGPLGSSLSNQSTFVWTQAIDRAFVSFDGDWGRARLGRQAIGFGRSTYFAVTDVLAPFGTFQIDQEWKSGVDAFDIEWELSEDWSLGFTEAAENGFSKGAFLGRTGMNFGDADVMLMGGQRSQDWMAALASSAALLDAEFHGELGFFFTDGSGVQQAQLGKNTVAKGVFGGSYNFDVLLGLTLLGEYHFNGFGLSDIPAQQSRLLDPAFQARFFRGDFQTLGQHEFALSANLTFNELLRGYGYSILSGQDGSGLFALGGTMDASDRFSLDLSAFVPWGKPSLDSTLSVLRSEYGASPTTVYVSMRFYD